MRVQSDSNKGIPIKIEVAKNEVQSFAKGAFMKMAHAETGTNLKDRSIEQRKGNGSVPTPNSQL